MLFLTLSYPLYGRTLYLSTSGDDSAAEGHGVEFRTLKRAVSCLEPGDTLIVKNGTYEGGVKIQIAATAEAPVLIRGKSLGAVISGSGSEIDAIRVQDASHVIIDRLTVREATRAGISIRFSNHIRITRCLCTDNSTWGIFTSFADDIHFERNECCRSKEQHGIYHSKSGDRFVIRGNLVHDNRMNGIHINSNTVIPGALIHWGIVEKNIIYGNGKGGGGSINMAHVQDVLVHNNLIYNNYANSITVYQDTGTFEQGSKRVLIMGNTIYFQPGTGRSGINIQTTSEKVVLAGNIFITGGSRGNLQVESDHLKTIVSDYNILWGMDSDRVVERKDRWVSLSAWRTLSGNDLHTRLVDPLFANIDSADFTLDPSSPALDAGMPMDTVRAILERLGDFEWIMDRLASLPDESICGWRNP
ncbi:MAG: right-handed parallel beta-helix repeat-containing protein [Gemmatimonadota bacterium]|nr:right-handed parallel beta-helix repeat-containing protein [Gemmatimonadota bacterium]